MIYEPLDEMKEQIRLISILPEKADTKQLECTLTVVSLVDFINDYRSFLDIHSSISKRQQLAAWWNGKTSKQVSDAEIPPAIPKKDWYRFKWGDFATLSYTWGSPNERESILVNGVETSITKNLAAALQTLRSLGCFAERYMLWVDSLCINQQNYAERGSQVAKMRDIFAGSWTTMTFLGPKADNSGKAIELMKTLADYEVKRKTNELKEILQIEPGHFGTDGKWLAFQAFLQRPYWSRLWIVQEVALAPPNAPMFAGEESITWKEVQDALTSIHTCLWYVKDGCLKHDRKILQAEQGKPDGEVSGRWDTKNLHHIDKGPARVARKEERGEILSQGDLLELAGGTSCMEPLDKVYGLLAFIDPAIAEKLVVDYNIGPSTLFCSIAKLFIESNNSLGLLREGNPWSQTDTPSWAPDWTVEDRNRDRLSPVLQYKADGGRPAQFSFSDNHRLLAVRGVIVDQVAQVGSRSMAGISNNDSQKHNTGQIREVQVAYESSDATRRALYNTLVGGRLGFMGQESITHGREMHIFNLPTSSEMAIAEFKKRGWEEFAIQGHRYDEWQNWRGYHDHINLRGSVGRVGDFFTDKLPVDVENHPLWQEFVRFRNVSMGRRFAIMESGRFGWVPGLEDEEEADIDKAVRLGDLFCIVFGCQVPLLVRPDGQNYRILGEGFIHGFMDGEVLEDIGAGKLADEDLTFC